MLLLLCYIIIDIGIIIVALHCTTRGFLAVLLTFHICMHSCIFVLFVFLTPALLHCLCILYITLYCCTEHCHCWYTWFACCSILHLFCLCFGAVVDIPHDSALCIVFVLPEGISCTSLLYCVLTMCGFWLDSSLPLLTGSGGHITTLVLTSCGWLHSLETYTSFHSDTLEAAWMH